MGISKEEEQKIMEWAERENAKKNLKKAYDLIIKILKKYCDLEEKYYSIIALWVIGTYFHKSFLTYPYLYFNATKGSGKTRILRLLAELSWNGMVVVDMTEANLFRLAGKHSFFIDEFEKGSYKEQTTLKLLLNSAYKKGLNVIRQKKNPKTNEQVTEIFEMFCPVAMANIWGLDNILEDRCITIVLTKSSDNRITKLLENFANEKEIDTIKELLSLNPVSFGVVSFVTSTIVSAWNDYIYKKTTLNDTTTLTTLNDTTTPVFNNDLKEYEPFFKILFEFDFSGRNLELFFPILYLAYEIDPNLLLFNEVAVNCLEMIKSKEQEDFYENKDYTFLDFLDYLWKNQIENKNEFISTKEICERFKEFLNLEDQEKKETKWINTHWVGNALKRLNLIKQKKRLNRGREFIIDFDKVLTLVKRFKPEAESDNQQKLEKIEDNVNIEKVEN